jgi:hypothetical protein
MVMMRTAGNAVALSSGQQNWEMRAGAEKYAKFVYSSRYAFSVEANERSFRQASVDGALALSDDGRHFRMREANEAALIAGDMLFARWRPWPDVSVETWLLPKAPWHIRLHRITTPRALQTAEGGFAVERADANEDVSVEEAGRALARTPTDLSAILDLSEAGARAGMVQKALPDTNLIFAKSLVPQLRGDIPAGTTVLMTAAMALPAGEAAEAALDAPPAAPDLDVLERLFAESGVDVSAMLVPERF